MRVTPTPTALNDGPISTKSNPCVILHSSNRHDLISLPESYSDLEFQVKRLYDLDRGQFYVESDGFTWCPGTRVRISEDAWAASVQLLQVKNLAPQLPRNDAYQMLGNVYIVSMEGDLAKTLTTSESNLLTKGETDLKEPFIDGDVLLLQIADFDSKAVPTSSTKLSVQIVDEEGATALAISIFPKSKWIFLTTPCAEINITSTVKDSFSVNSKEHVIAIIKEGPRFSIYFDFIHFSSIEGPSNDLSLNTVAYDLGSNSPFKGPVSVTVYPNLFTALQKTSFFRSMFPLDNETLFQQILSCDRNEAAYVSEVVSNIYGNLLLNNPTPGIQWQSHDTDDKSGWISLQWDMGPRSIFFTRFSPPPGGTSDADFGTVTIGGRSEYTFLGIRFTSTAAHLVDSHNGCCGQYTIRLPNLPRGHTVAFVNQHNEIRAIFDFRTSHTVKGWKPNRIKFDKPGACIIEAGVIHFSR